MWIAVDALQLCSAPVENFLMLANHRKLSCADYDNHLGAGRRQKSEAGQRSRGEHIVRNLGGLKRS